MENENFRRISLEMTARSMGQVAFESVFILTIMFCAFFGNFSICLAMYRNPRIRTITSLYLIALSVSDILISTAVMPFSAAVFIRGKWVFGEDTCTIQGIFVVSLAWTSLHIMTLIAINRYFCVLKPNVYKKWFTQKRSVLMIASACILPFVLAIVPYMDGMVTYIFRPGKTACFMTFKDDIEYGKYAYTIFLLISYTAIPMLTIVVCYYKVVRTVKKHSINVGASFRSNQNIGIRPDEVRATKMVFAVVLGFLVCWIPVMIVDSLNTFLGIGSLPRAAYVAYIFFAYMSSCINPFVCIVLNKSIRKEVLNILPCRRGRQLRARERFQLQEVRINRNAFVMDLRMYDM